MKKIFISYFALIYTRSMVFHHRIILNIIHICDKHQIITIIIHQISLNFPFLHIQRLAYLHIFFSKFFIIRMTYSTKNFIYHVLNLINIIQHQMNLIVIHHQPVHIQYNYIIPPHHISCIHLVIKVKIKLECMCI